MKMNGMRTHTSYYLECIHPKDGSLGTDRSFEASLQETAPSILGQYYQSRGLPSTLN